MKIVFALCLVTACGDPTNHPIDAHVIHGDPDAPAADAPIDAPAPRSGLVSLAQDANSSSAGAIFAYDDVFGSAVGVDGPCTVTLNPATHGLSAGSIAITGTATALSLDPTGTAPAVTYHSTPTAPNPLFTAGATLSVHAAGGPDFPAFDATVTGPTTLAGYVVPTALSRAGYTATWTAGAAHVWVILAATNHTSIPAYVVCRVDDNGSFTIPDSTFALIPAGYDSAAVGVGRVSTTDVTTTAGHVTVAAISDITSGFVTLGP